MSTPETSTPETSTPETGSANPFEDVMPCQVSRVVFGKPHDLIRLGWCSEAELADPPKPAGQLKPCAVVLVSCHNERLGGVLWTMDYKSARWTAMDLASQTPGRAVAVSIESPRRRARREASGANLRPPAGTYLPFTNVGVRDMTKIVGRPGRRSPAPLRDSTWRFLAEAGLAPLDRVGGATPEVPTAGA